MQDIVGIKFHCSGKMLGLAVKQDLQIYISFGALRLHQASW